MNKQSFNNSIALFFGKPFSFIKLEMGINENTFQGWRANLVRSWVYVNFKGQPGQIFPSLVGKIGS